MNKLAKVDIFSPNEIETALITGIRPDTLDDCLRASMAICSQTDVRYVVLKLGARGCYVYDGKYCDLIAPFVVQAVDTTAAGDAFTAALATEFLRTGDITASGTLCQRGRRAHRDHGPAPSILCRRVRRSAGFWNKSESYREKCPRLDAAGVLKIKGGTKHPHPLGALVLKYKKGGKS